MGQRQASPLAIVIAVVVLLVLLFVIYKITLGRDPLPEPRYTVSLKGGDPTRTFDDVFGMQLAHGMLRLHSTSVPIIVDLPLVGVNEIIVEQSTPLAEADDHVGSPLTPERR